MLSEQELLRRTKREELMRMGIDPYPAELFDVTHTTQQLRDAFGDKAFDNAALAALVGPVFDKIAGSLVDAFVKRAEQVYGET